MATCDASIQTPEPLPLAVPPQTNSPPFNWADEAASLPIQILPRPLPCDLSNLHSSKLNPFLSLHHSKNCRTHQSCHHYSCFNFNSFNSSYHNSFTSFQPCFTIILTLTRNLILGFLVSVVLSRLQDGSVLLDSTSFCFYFCFYFFFHVCFNIFFRFIFFDQFFCIEMTQTLSKGGGADGIVGCDLPVT